MKNTLSYFLSLLNLPTIGAEPPVHIIGSVHQSMAIRTPNLLTTSIQNPSSTSSGHPTLLPTALRTTAFAVYTQPTQGTVLVNAPPNSRAQGASTKVMFGAAMRIGSIKNKKGRISGFIFFEKNADVSPNQSNGLIRIRSYLETKRAYSFSYSKGEILSCPRKS